MSQSLDLKSLVVNVTLIKGSNHILESIFPSAEFQPPRFKQIDTIEERASAENTCS